MKYMYANIKEDRVHREIHGTKRIPRGFRTVVVLSRAGAVLIRLATQCVT